MKKKIGLWLPITTFFVFSVLFYGPLGIYLSNSEELWFSLSDVLKITGAVSAVVFAVAMVAGIALPGKINTFAARLLFGGALALYLQGNFINISYGGGVLDGSEIVWADYLTYACVDTLVWVVCLALPFVLSRIPKLCKSGMDRKIMILLSLFFIVIQLPALAVQLVGYRPNAQQDLEITTDGIYELSTGENVVVFVLDTFDEQYYQDFIGKNPSFEEKLSDFVHYDNALASGARTIVAMPSMLTGQPFRRETTYSEYLDRIWSDENVLRSMHDSGTDVRVFSETTYFTKETADYISNFRTDGGHSASYKILARKLYKLTGFIFAPHLAKRYFWFDTAEFNEAISGDAYKMNDIRFVERYEAEQFRTTNSYDKAFRLYHLDGTHPPYKMGKDGKADPDATRRSAAKGIMRSVVAMINDMKQKGVYDAATIVITADHGDNNKAEYPLFLVKQAHHTGPYTTSHAPVSLFDLPLVIADAFDLQLGSQEYGMHLTDLTEGMYRQRRFFQNSSGNSRVKICEYSTQSDAADIDALMLVGEFEDAGGDEPYVLGEELSFTADATGNRYAAEGFSSNTGFRTRLRGPKSVLQIPIAELPERETLTVRVDPFIEAPVYMEIVANDVPVYTASLNKSNHREIFEFEIPVSAIRGTDGNVLTLEMRFPEITDKSTQSMSLVSMTIS